MGLRLRVVCLVQIIRVDYPCYPNCALRVVVVRAVRPSNFAIPDFTQGGKSSPIIDDLVVA
jgi:hypothetical protein